MIDLQKIIDGLFYDEAITNERLLACGIDNISRMTNNNAGNEYDDNITNTTTACDELKAAMVLTKSDTGTRKGGRTAKDNARTAIEKYLALQILAAAVAFQGKKTQGYEETFPNGMDSFYSVSKETFALNVETLINKATKYVAVLGVPFKNTLTSMFATYTTANDNLIDAKTDVGDDRTDEDEKALTLADQLTDNLCLVGHYNRRSKTALAEFFDLSLLYPQHRTKIFKGNPAAHSETEVCEIEYSAGKRVHIHNTGIGPLTFGFKLNGIKVGEITTLKNDEKSNESFEHYFTNGTSIYVLN
ncbi:MAG: hypothetical protein WCH34_16855, partial [Bacteroidota bacterium]